MRTVYRSALVHFSQQQMFDLVYAVDKYHEFLPWCAAGSFIRQEDSMTDAKVDIDYKGFAQSFSTRNLICRHQSISMTLLDGPFKHLIGDWNFSRLDDCSTKVELSMEFEFKGFLLGKLAGPIFEKIVANMVDAFVKRADDIYG